MCRPSAEVKNLGNVLPPNSISFGGVNCSFDGLVLQRQFGINSLSRARNSSLGTVVAAYPGPWTCHGSTRRLLDLYFFRPASVVDIRFPGESVIFFQKGVLYFAFTSFDQVRGSCIYRNTNGKEPSLDKKKNSPRNSGGPNLWAWLGPVIAAVATIVVAFIIIFRRSRRYSATSNFQVASSSPVL